VPTYSYKCLTCESVFEVTQSIKDDALTSSACPSCGKTRKVTKVFTPVGVTFNGSGFYKTDARSSTKSSGSSSGSSKSSDSSSSSSSESSSSTSTTSADSGTAATSSTATSTDSKTKSSPAAAGASST
jgi:putative FmdB family regulatory protein